MSNVWEFVKVGRYEEACAAADEEYAQKPSLLVLRNKRFALMSLKRHQEAISLSRQLIENDLYSSQSDWLFLGAALWLTGRCEDAVGAWREGAKAKYTDAAGGVLSPLALLYASTRLAREDLQLESLAGLRQVAAVNSGRNWPGPIAEFAAGDLTDQELLTVVSQVPILRQKQMCQAKFYIGVMCCRNGSNSHFRKAMTEASSQGSVARSLHEFYLAEAEAAGSIESLQ